MNYFDEFDSMADKACEAIKAKARRFKASGAIEKTEDIKDLWETKAALCAALQQEVYQWRPPHASGPTKTECNLMHF